MNTTLAMRQYKQVGVHSQIMDATPHRLVQMLMEGVLNRISTAKGNITRKEVSEKGKNISHAIAILGELNASLNPELGGELAENLSNLYDYMTRRLITANLHNDEVILDEVSGLMLDIKSAWDAIPNLLEAGAKG